MTENYETGGWWGQNTALWAIVAIIIVIAFLWFCHKQGEDKANLAGSIQQLYGRVNAIEPAVTANAQNVYRINNTLAQTVQGVQCIKDDAFPCACFSKQNIESSRKINAQLFD